MTKNNNSNDGSMSDNKHSSSACEKVYAKKGTTRFLAYFVFFPLFLSLSLSGMVATSPVGFKIVEVPPGLAVVSVPFVSATSVELTVDFVGDSGVLYLNASPDATDGMYLHVLSGASLGRIATIQSVSGNHLQIETELDIAAGDRVAIREHKTVDSILQGATFSTGDTLTLYNLDGTVKPLSYFEGFGWFDTAFAPAGDVFIFPGEAFVVNTSLGFSLVSFGEVLTAPIAVSFQQGNIAIVGNLNPLDEVDLTEVFAPAVVGGDTLTKYASIEGALVPSGIYTYFAGFGFYDSNFQEIGDVGIPVAGGVVLISGTSGQVVLPPAYSPNEFE